MKILVALSGGHDEADDPVIAAVARIPWGPGTELRVVSVTEVIQPVMVGMVPDALDTGEMQAVTEERAKSTAAASIKRFRSSVLRRKGPRCKASRRLPSVNTRRTGAPT